jgi:preprotein translocase subunit SecD
MAAAATAVVLVATACATTSGSAAKSAGSGVTVRFSADAGTSETAMGDAAAVIRQRVAADHLTGVDVKVDGTTVSVSGPNQDSASIKALGVSGSLWFRQVAEARGGYSVHGTPSQPSALAADGVLRQTEPDAPTQQLFQTIDCTSPPSTIGDAAAEDFAVACSLDKKTAYLLAPADVGGFDITSASARQSQTSQGVITSGWEIDLSLKDPGKSQFGAVTGLLAQNGGEFAIVMDGVVYTAAAVQEVIPSGMARITGDFTQQTADDLAAVLQAGALPTALHLDH